MKKITKTLILAAALAGSISSVSYAGWLRQNNQWQYQQADGSLARSGWYWIRSDIDNQERCYCFDQAGNLYVNTVAQGYSVDENGAWTVNGQVQTRSGDGWRLEETNWRYRLKGQDLAAEWLQTDGQKYYFDDEGNMVTGFQIIGRYRYYFGEDGGLLRKTFRLNGVYYYIPASDGVIVDEVNEFNWSEYREENDIDDDD